MAHYVTGFGLALCFHSLFTKAILQTPIIKMVVCPLLLRRFYSHFYAVKFQEKIVIKFIDYQLLTLTFLFEFSLLSVFIDGVEAVIFHF